MKTEQKLSEDIERLDIWREKGGKYHIYALVMELPGDYFVVKLGMSGDPWSRYEQLSTGLPFTSVMLRAWVGHQRLAYRIEHELHDHFDDRRTKGEWFWFHLKDKQEFHKGCKQVYCWFMGRALEWEPITMKGMRVNLRRRA